MSGRWADSTRAQGLPHNWRREIRPRILNRDPICRCHSCDTHPHQPCPNPSVEVDHIGARHIHDDWNLQGLCSDCHSNKTQTEAAQGRARERARKPRQRPKPRHPGLIN